MAARTQIEILTATGVPVQLAIAGPGARSYAFTTDLLIRFVLASGWYLLMVRAIGLAIPGAKEQATTQATFYAAGLPAFLIYLGYHPLFEALWSGRTPGKRIAGVRLVDGEGRPPSLTAVLVRNVFRIVDSIPMTYAVGLVSCVVTAHAQRLGDIAAGTLLVYAEGTVDASNFDDRVLSASTAPRVAVAKELLERWQRLDPAYRRRLAGKLLAIPADADPRADTEAALKQRLTELVDAGA